MENLNSSFITFFSLASPLIMMIISIFYISKKLRPDSILLLLGSVVLFATSSVYIYLPYYFQSIYASSTTIQNYFLIINIVTFLGSILFTAGFLMLILQILKCDKHNSLVYRLNKKSMRK